MAKKLKNLLSNFFGTQEAWKIDLLRNWNAIMGPLSSKACIEKITTDTVILAVNNSCWMQELYLLSDVLIKTINQNLDKPRIKHIRFKRAGSNGKKEQKKSSSTCTNRTPKEITLTAKQKGALTYIKDPQLRKALEQFLKRCHGEHG